MKALLDRLHARVGDLWWYSAMLFIACRSGDVIQAFIGLWLVPKYVGPGELGAVLPLQQLSSFFTVPLAIVAVVFSRSAAQPQWGLPLLYTLNRSDTQQRLNGKHLRRGNLSRH